MSFDAEAQALVERFDYLVNQATSQEEAVSHAWMIELAAREISHAHGAAANETVHWMRLRLGEINHFITHRWGSGGTRSGPLCGLLEVAEIRYPSVKYRAVGAGMVYRVRVPGGQRSQMPVWEGLEFVIRLDEEAISCA